MNSKQAEDQFYIAYKQFGGKKTRQQYDKIRTEFVKHTLNSYVVGITTSRKGETIIEDGEWLYFNKQESWNGFMKTTKTSSSETFKIFKSLDSVSTYS